MTENNFPSGLTFSSSSTVTPCYQRPHSKPAKSLTHIHQPVQSVSDSSRRHVTPTVLDDSWFCQLTLTMILLSHWYLMLINAQYQSTTPLKPLGTSEQTYMISSNASGLHHAVVLLPEAVFTSSLLSRHCFLLPAARGVNHGHYIYDSIRLPALLSLDCVI